MRVVSQALCNIIIIIPHSSHQAVSKIPEKKNQISDGLTLKFPQQPCGCETHLCLCAPPFPRPADTDHKKSDILRNM